MSQHHHHHSSCCNTCCCSSCCCSSNSTAPSPISDHLLQTLTTQILLQPQPQPQIFLKPQHPVTNIDNATPRRPHHHQPKPDDDGDQTSLLLRSLLRRVAALESSLSSSNLSPPQKRPSSSQRQSLKHAAAVTIQRHFRRFLARRSRTLRDLKLLASIKSHAAALRSSLSDKNPRALSRKAADLLFQLDSIQSSDPMIREGKRSIRRELVRVSEFVEKVLIRERVEADELERRRDGRRRVSFVENGDEDELLDELPERNSEEEERRGFYERFSDGEESPRVNSNGGVNGGSSGSYRLSPPLPVKMDP